MSIDTHPKIERTNPEISWTELKPHQMRVGQTHGLVQTLRIKEFWADKPANHFPYRDEDGDNFVVEPEGIIPELVAEAQGRLEYLMSEDPERFAAELARVAAAEIGVIGKKSAYAIPHQVEQAAELAILKVLGIKPLIGES